MGGADEREAGLTLAHYAAIKAALAEPFPLDEVLRVEGVAPEIWTAADVGWTARVATEATLLRPYEVALALAEDKLTRAVVPVDAELEAWAAFLALFDAAEPGELLREHGLGTNDLARLSRTWARRLEREPALAKRAGEIAKRGAKKLPPLRVGPRQLRPSPDAGSAARREEAAKPPAPAPVGELPLALDRYAALSAELSVTPAGKVAAVLTRFELTAAEREGIDRTFRARLLADREMAADFARLRAHHLARIAARASAQGARPSQAPASLPRPLPPPLPPPLPRPAAPQRRPAFPIDEPSTVIGAAPSSEAMPFRAEPSREFAAALAARGSAAPGTGSDGETVMMKSPVDDPPTIVTPDGDEADTLIRPSPFSSPAPSSAQSPDSARASAVPPALGSRTSPAAPSPLGGKALPFSPDAEPVLAPRSERAPQHVDTGTVSAVPSPFQNAALPFQNTAASAAEPMSLERHAALCAEVAVQPARAAEALARYGVDAARKDVADAWWRSRAAGDPAVRAAWTRAFDAHHARLRQGG